MTILCMILQANKIDNISIIRHNQQEDNYDFIDIDKLSNNIVSYIDTSKSKSSPEKYNKYNILCDISFILSVFGNDFYTKIESINVKQDFEDLINAYVKLIENKKYLIDIRTQLKF